MATVELVDRAADGSQNPNAHFHSAEYENLKRGINGCGVIGHTFSATVTGADMIITFPAITAWVPDGSGGSKYVSYAGGTVTLAVGDATNPRTDMLYLASDATMNKVAGAATSEAGDVEEAPMGVLPSNAIMIGKARVDTNVTALAVAKFVGRAIDVSEQHALTPPKGSDIASAATLTLPDSSAAFFHVTGTTTITAISSRPAGAIVVLEFDGALQLTHNATTLILIGGTNYVTVAGETLAFVAEGSGNYRQIVAPAVKAAIPEFLNPLMPFDNEGLAASVMIANQAYLIPIVPLTANVSLTALIMRVNVSSGNIDWGIYSTTDDVTWTRVASAGLTACPGPSSGTSLALSVTLYAGVRYAFAFACDNGTATFGNYGNGGSGSVLTVAPARTRAASFPLPASITGVGNIQTLIPSILGKISGGLL